MAEEEEQEGTVGRRKHGKGRLAAAGAAGAPPLRAAEAAAIRVVEEREREERRAREGEPSLSLQAPTQARALLAPLRARTWVWV